MDNIAIQRASDLLYAHWIAGSVITELPIDIRPEIRSDGYAIQARLETKTQRQLYGWKIAATSQAGQAHIGVNGPIAGRILADRVIPSGGMVPDAPNRMAVAEAEFAFQMSRDLGPRSVPYSVEEVLAAVATVHAAIEVPDSRYEDFTSVGAPQLIADNACAHYFVLAEATATDWRSLDLTKHRVVGRVEGKTEREGFGRNVLGDPRFALTWLANELSGLGVALRAGQIVTTGACVPPLDITSGDLVTADFGLLGVATVRFA
ncbi:2-keto-4-pentenoate hydratase [Paraburkholderia strydomiana]|uniref:2-keto-4-pentenoate hydratase n=1 Tax=Paraburkholderia strydomiana TaxID=1245417 RepID=UPI0038BAFE42